MKLQRESSGKMSIGFGFICFGMLMQTSTHTLMESALIALTVAVFYFCMPQRRVK
jgi:hypothetical protein